MAWIRTWNGLPVQKRTLLVCPKTTFSVWPQNLFPA
jgi:hypothetical protein